MDDNDSSSRENMKSEHCQNCQLRLFFPCRMTSSLSANVWKQLRGAPPELHACVQSCPTRFGPSVRLAFLEHRGTVSVWESPRNESTQALSIRSRTLGRGEGTRAIYVPSQAPICTHTHWLRLVRPLWSGAVAKSKPNSGTLGLLCLILEPLALSRPCFKIHCGFKEQHSQQWGGQAWKI